MVPIRHRSVVRALIPRCARNSLFSSHAPARLLEREAQREDLCQIAKLRKLPEAALDALEGWRNEIEVMQPPALDGLSGIGPDDLDRSLQQGLEVSIPQAAVLTPQSGIVGHQLHFG